MKSTNLFMHVKDAVIFNISVKTGFTRVNKKLAFFVFLKMKAFQFR